MPVSRSNTNSPKAWTIVSVHSWRQHSFSLYQISHSSESFPSGSEFSGFLWLLRSQNPNPDQSKQRFWGNTRFWCPQHVLDLDLTEACSAEPTNNIWSENLLQTDCWGFFLLHMLEHPTGYGLIGLAAWRNFCVIFSISNDFGIEAGYFCFLRNGFLYLHIPAILASHQKICHSGHWQPVSLIP